MVGSFIVDWNEMPKENISIVVGMAVALTIIDIIIENWR
jgi:hypothetical protein